MPITQDRMLALIHAADTNLARHRALRNELNRIANDPDADLGTALARIVADAAYMPDEQSVETIASERMHFRRAQGRNDRNRRKAQAKRGDTMDNLLRIAPTYAPHHAGPGHALPHAHARRKETARRIDTWEAIDDHGGNINDTLQGLAPRGAPQGGTDELTLGDEPDARTLAADKDFESELAREELTRGKDPTYVVPNVNIPKGSNNT